MRTKHDAPSYYRPPFYLGDRFVDAKKRVFEIIETQWGLPEVEYQEHDMHSIVELHNGHRIRLFGPPVGGVLKKVGLVREGGENARLNILTVDKLSELVDKRSVVRL